MPTLPLFSMPSAAQSLPPAQPVTNKLSHQTPDGDSSWLMNIQANAMNVDIEPPEGFQNNNPFMQSLMAAFTLPQGQTLAAITNEAEQYIENIDINGDIHSDVNVEMEAMNIVQSQYVDPLLSPWQMNAQTDQINAELRFNLEHINQQRNANPEITNGSGVLSAGIKGLNLGSSQYQIGQGDTTDSLDIDATLPAMAVNIQAQSQKPGLLTGELPSNRETLMEASFDSEASLSLLEEDINIHEKPLTLTSVKPEQMTTSVIDDAVNMEMDSLGDHDSLLNMGMTEDKKIKQMEQLTERKLENELTPKNFKLDVPPNDVKWTEQIAKRISIMSADQLQTARIQLDPPELGSLDVKIRIHHDQMSVAFSSNQPQVREALESQAPRLREMMEQQGMNLVDVNVSSQQQGGGSNPSSQEEGNAMSLVDDSTLESTNTVQLETDSLVDYFA